jgi:hypothetical protein
MPNGPAAEVAELLSVPLEQLVTALGRGIGEAQSALDLHSIDIQRQIDEDPVLAQYGLQATWYQIPSTQLELKVAVAAQEPPRPAGAPPGPVIHRIGGVERPALPRIWAQPVNARYRNQFGYDVTAASTVSLTVVPVPPPNQAAAGRPTRTTEEALAIADPDLAKDPAGQPIGRVTVNYNPGARSWYVLQTQETDDTTTLLRLVRIDDETGTVTKRVTGGS